MSVSPWDRCIVFSPWRRHPTLHPTRQFPKLHQDPLEIFLGEIPQAGIVPGSLLELLPTFHFSPCFFHVLSCPSKELPMASYGLEWEGVRRVRSAWLSHVLSCFVRFLDLACGCCPLFYEEFRASPVHFSLGEITQNSIQLASLLEVFPTFHFSLYFFHLLFSKKHLVLIVFSCFVLFLCWLGGCSSYFFIRSFPDISHTPRLISTLVEIPQSGIQHGSFLEVAPTCPNLSLFPLLLPPAFQQEAFGCDYFFSCFVLFLGWLGGCGSFFFIRRVRTSHIPLE